MLSEMRDALLIAVAVVIALGGGPVAGAAEASGPGPSALLVTARPLKDAVIEGEPVFLDLAVENTGGGDVWVDGLEPRAVVPDSRFVVWVRRPHSADFVSCRARINVHEVFRTRPPLEPGMIYRFRVPAVLDAGERRGIVFDEVGRYEVKAGFRATTVEWPKSKQDRLYAESAPVAVRVLPAEGRDKEALQLWRAAMEMEHVVTVDVCGIGSAEDRAYQENHFRDGGVSDRYAPFDRIRTAYGDTVFGRYCWFFATDPWRKYARTPAGESAPDGGALHRQVLEDLYLNARDFALRDEVMMALAEAYSVAQRHDDAAAVLGELLAEYPDSPLAEEAAERKPWYERYAEDAERAAVREAAEGE